MTIQSPAEPNERRLQQYEGDCRENDRAHVVLELQSITWCVCEAAAKSVKFADAGITA